MVEQIKNNPFNRPPRIQDAFRPVEIDVPAPPAPPDEPARNLLLMILPMGSFMVMGLFYALAFRGGTGTSGWLYALPMIAMSIFTFISAFVMFGEQKHQQKQKTIKQLRDYHRTLDKKEARLIAGRNLQTELLYERFPSPEEIIRRVKKLEVSLWQRRKEDPDFLAFRLGLGETSSQVKIKNPDPDIISEQIRRAFGIYTKYRHLPETPVSIDLAALSSVAIVGRRNSTVPFVRALLTQVAALNSPDNVHVYLFSSERYYRIWQWLRWLPHTSASHVGGQPNFLAFKRDDNKNLLAQISKEIDDILQTSEDKTNPVQPATAYLMIFDDEYGVRDEPFFDQIMKRGKDHNAYSIILCENLEDVPSDCQSVIELGRNNFEFSKVGSDGIKLSGIFDKVEFVEADNLAHRLTPISIRSLGQDARIPTKVNLLQVYQVNAIDSLGIDEKWRRIPEKDGLLPFSIPLGSETYSSPMVIHLAENKDGPHGLIAGTTGSGKSELLQMLVSTLAVEHHPYLVNFLLVDFKGASTFGVFEDLPHTVGLVSNLDKLSALRALEAIKAENTRRQIFLRENGVEDISEYHEKLYRLGMLTRDWEPLPHLFIIVDEFAQMAQDMPTFLPELVATVRVGRSLGLHLILATQRPAGVVNDEMRANLNFRISLRVQTIDDSRDMLRRPDAAFLPSNLPGRAYFQLGDGGVPRQFQVARAGVPYEDLSEQAVIDANQVFIIEYEKKTPVIDDKSRTVDVEKDDGKKQDDKPSIAKTLSEYMKERYAQSGYREMPPILLPPLPMPGNPEKELKVSALLEKADETSLASSDMKFTRWDVEKNTWTSHRGYRDFKVPIGIIDSLATRSQPAQWIDFLNFGGHVMVVGGPQSGKTYFLQTLAYNIARGYDPSEVSMYVLSFAGREMEIVQELPHVGSVIQGNETEKLNRLLRYIRHQVIEIRKHDFSRQRAKDLQEYNLSVPPENRYPFICVMIDNFGELRNPEYDDQLTEIEKLIQVGRIYGVHFVITALQGNDIPYKISNLIQQRLAFNMADRNEYILLVGRPESLDFDALPKGRAFISGSPPMQCQIACPPSKSEWDLLKTSMTLTWNELNGARPHEIKELETRVFLSDLWEKSDSIGDKDLTGIVGIDGDSLEPFALNWKLQGPHFLLGGPSQSGRTAVLHAAVLSLTDRYSPDELWVVLMDGANGSLRFLKSLPHVIDWVTEEDGLARNIACLQAELTARRERSTRAQEQHRNLPQFPEIIFVIDDYDLTCEALDINDIILTKLGKHLRQDSDLGFHVIISVLSDNLQGAGDPLIKQLRLARAGISLSNVDTLEYLGGRSTHAMRQEELNEGRGYLVTRTGSRLIQFGLPDNKQGDLSIYERVAIKWKKFSRSKWATPATSEQIEQVRQDSAPAPRQKPASSVSGGKNLIDMDEALKRYIEQQRRLKSGGK